MIYMFIYATVQLGQVYVRFTASMVVMCIRSNPKLSLARITLIHKPVRRRLHSTYATLPLNIN